jgi:hypothetical protein
MAELSESQAQGAHHSGLWLTFLIQQGNPHFFVAERFNTRLVKWVIGKSNTEWELSLRPLKYSVVLT